MTHGQELQQEPQQQQTLQQQQQQHDDGAKDPHNKNHLVRVPLIVLDGSRQRTVQLAIDCDWGVGIGGGLWSCSILMLRYMQSERAFFSRVFNGARVLELGAGTGMLALSTGILFQPSLLTITDQQSHQDICASNCSRNAHLLSPGCRVETRAFSWGEDRAGTLCSTNGGTSCAEQQEHDGSTQFFDVVLGADLAYFTHLYAPLAAALAEVVGPHTVAFLGVTKSDTGPAFFSMLSAAGLRYYDMPSGAAETANFTIFTIFR